VSSGRRSPYSAPVRFAPARFGLFRFARALAVAALSALAVGALSALAVGAAAIAGGGCTRHRMEASTVRIADILADPAALEGRTVSLTLDYGKRDPDDRVADLISRSDCYLHDETGSILLFGGWQVWMDWRDSGEYRSDWLDVDPAGRWHVKAATVRLTPEGLPYLEPPGEDGP